MKEKRNNTYQVHIHTRFSDTLMSELKLIAKKEKMSMTSIIIRLIRNYIDEYNQK